MGAYSEWPFHVSSAVFFAHMLVPLSTWLGTRCFNPSTPPLFVSSFRSYHSSLSVSLVVTRSLWQPHIVLGRSCIYRLPS
ncbi:hypothetical protein BD311DRAFT_753438 [Dichomitus squalens]|uniref:Secreted protein n=1 Tax=Dichomitus squalens TaxID=114155 RepID=A0A4Q9MTD6_9APHY|nr:hypothetical protein BD311DRAFT_753438 [Dichomitus squalens]